MNACASLRSRAPIRYSARERGSSARRRYVKRRRIRCNTDRGDSAVQNAADLFVRGSFAESRNAWSKRTRKTSRSTPRLRKRAASWLSSFAAIAKQMCSTSTAEASRSLAKCCASRSACFNCEVVLCGVRSSTGSAAFDEVVDSNAPQSSPASARIFAVVDIRASPSASRRCSTSTCACPRARAFSKARVIRSCAVCDSSSISTKTARSSFPARDVVPRGCRHGIQTQ